MVILKLFFITKRSSFPATYSFFQLPLQLGHGIVPILTEETSGKFARVVEVEKNTLLPINERLSFSSTSL